MDSPRHSAKYCTYTVMNQDDKKILAMEIVDKMECHLKSGTMEAKGFRRSVRSLQEQDVVLKEIVTDAHPQISYIMSMLFIGNILCRENFESNLFSIIACNFHIIF